MCERKSFADTQVSAEGEGRGALDKVKTKVEAALPLEDHRGAEINQQPLEEPTLEQVGGQRRL